MVYSEWTAANSGYKALESDKPLEPYVYRGSEIDVSPWKQTFLTRLSNAEILGIPEEILQRAVRAVGKNEANFDQVWLSRSAEEVDGHGIPTSFHDNQVVTSWIGGLLLPLTACPTYDEILTTTNKQFNYWPPDIQFTTYSVFDSIPHAMIQMSALLLALDLPLPRCFCRAGYWVFTTESKIQPSPNMIQSACSKFTVDGFRYCLVNAMCPWVCTMSL